jgi:hypothetical protein
MHGVKSAERTAYLSEPDNQLNRAECGCNGITMMINNFFLHGNFAFRCMIVRGFEMRLGLFFRIWPPGRGCGFQDASNSNSDRLTSFDAEETTTHRRKSV